MVIVHYNEQLEYGHVQRPPECNIAQIRAVVKDSYALVTVLGRIARRDHRRPPERGRLQFDERQRARTAKCRPDRSDLCTDRGGDARRYIYGNRASYRWANTDCDALRIRPW